MDVEDSKNEVGGLLGQWQRAGLSVRLAHELHTFVESQERSRFEELRLELLLQEKLWAVEASRIHKELGNFGISNAAHGSQSANRGSIEGLSMPLEADTLAMTWSNKPYRSCNIRKGISGVSTVINGACPACPCKSALAQSGQLCKEIRSDSLKVPRTLEAAPDAFMDREDMEDRTQELENFQDFRQHLRLLLAARASVMAAEASLESFHASMGFGDEDGASGLPASLSPESRQTAHVARDAKESLSPSKLATSASSIRSAGLKQLMALHQPKPKPASTQISQQQGDAAPRPGIRMVSQLKAVDQKSSRLQEHLSGILTATVQDDYVIDLVKDVAEQTQVEAEPVEGIELSDEIKEEFASSFLQLAETRAKETVETETAQAAEGTGSAGLAEVPETEPTRTWERRADAVDAMDAVERVADPAVAASHDGPEEATEAPPDSGQNSARMDVEIDGRVQLTLAERAMVRKTKLLQWQKASEFLRSDEPNSTSSWQLAEVLLEVGFARHRLREVLKHRTLLRRWHSRGQTAEWLKRKVQSAQEVVDTALSPPWNKEESLERDEKIERLWFRSPRGKSHIFSLMIYVEAVVAAYDAERSRVLTICGMSADSGFDGEPSEDCEVTLHALEREVAKSLRSISECRRLLLDLFDKAAKGGMQTEQREVSSGSKLVEAKVDEGRRNKWAEVYADLLHVEAKDSTTITVKTSQGVAWAKT